MHFPFRFGPFVDTWLLRWPARPTRPARPTPRLPFVAAGVALAVWCVTFSSPCGAQQNSESLISQLIAPTVPGALQLRSASDVREFYQSRQFAPAWTVESRASEAIRVLRNSGSDGLKPAEFRLGAIVADRKAHSERKAAESDVLLTDAMLTYIHEMSGSRVNPARLSHFIALPPPVVSAPEILETSLTADTLQSLPARLAPPHPEYALLKSGLAHYRGKTSSRAAQIIANMERWRWVPREFGDFYIEVNSADSTLRLVKGGETVFSTLLVTGTRSMPTPLFETAINAVTVNPYWDIPGDIAVRELMPKQVRHPGYLEARHIVAGQRPDGALRQLPGADNAMGRFLMEMPNSYYAYLHDTPEKNLFEKSDRHFSHGCMRVENMAQLVSDLIANDGADSVGEVSSALGSGETQTLPLSRPVPVYVLYWTVVPGANGSLALHRDVYGWDAAVLAALDQH